MTNKESKAKMVIDLAEAARRLLDASDGHSFEVPHDKEPGRRISVHFVEGEGPTFWIFSCVGPSVGLRDMVETDLLSVVEHLSKLEKMAHATARKHVEAKSALVSFLDRFLGKKGNS